MFWNLRILIPPRLAHPPQAATKRRRFSIAAFPTFAGTPGLHERINSLSEAEALLRDELRHMPLHHAVHDKVVDFGDDFVLPEHPRQPQPKKEKKHRRKKAPHRPANPVSTQIPEQSTKYTWRFSLNSGASSLWIPFSKLRFSLPPRSRSATMTTSQISVQAVTPPTWT